MTHLVDAIFRHVQHASAAEALLFLALGMLMESTCVPLPSEVVLPLAGIWARQQGIPALVQVEIAVILGSLAGSALMYAVGRYGGTPLFERYGRYVLVTPHHLEQAHSWIERYGASAVAAARLMFGVRHVSSFAAGVLRMSFPRFMVATFVGAGVWDTLGVLLGYYYGEKVHGLLHHMSVGVFGSAALVVVLGAAVYHKKVRAGKP